MAALVPPRLEMVTDGRAVHAVTFGGDSEFNELTRCELFSGSLVSQFQFSHESFLLLTASGLTLATRHARLRRARDRS
ncbi:hypothetical protein MPRM_33810 [Mycobacterium parmense]|uniref:Uncharacterized protein n=1 Tax=Mycobacterium parmense TaxID=185642 RepID=A0A7I7YWB8_9MYCO|nr:hypothetical protein MPRM_33810 [Mycobacterium parmense]